MEQDISRGLVGVEMLLVGDLNARLEQPRNQQEEDMATTIEKYRIVDQSLHFIQRQRYIGKGGWSWRMCRDGIPITGRGDYILGTECRDFYNVCIKEPRVSTDHWMILAKLKGYGVRRNLRYCKRRYIWTIVAPKWVPTQGGDANPKNLKN